MSSVSSISSTDCSVSLASLNSLELSPKKLRSPPPAVLNELEYVPFSEDEPDNHKEARNLPLTTSGLFGTALADAAASTATFAVVRTSVEIVMANTMSQPLRMQPIFPSAPVISLCWWFIVLVGGAALGATHVFVAGATQKYVQQFLPYFNFQIAETRYSMTRDMLNKDLPSLVGFSISGLVSSNIFYNTPLSALVRMLFFASFGAFLTSLATSIAQHRQPVHYTLQYGDEMPRRNRRSWTWILAGEISRYVHEDDPDVRSMDRLAKIVGGMSARSASVLTAAGVAATVRAAGSSPSTRGAATLIGMFSAMNFEIAWAACLRVQEWASKQRRLREHKSIV